MTSNTNGIIFLSGILVIIVASSFIINKSMFQEGYSNYLATPSTNGFGSRQNKEPGNRASEVGTLLADSYPSTGRSTVSDNNYDTRWQDYPVFGVGSFAQITNNLRYWKNPDESQCRTPEFCNALYNDKQVESNISKPLPPAPAVDNNNIRVNFYTTNKNLFLGPQIGPELPAF